MSALPTRNGGRREPVLDLTLREEERPSVRIRRGSDDPGVVYDMATLGDLGQFQRVKLNRLWARLGQLSITPSGSPADMTIADTVEWDATIETACRLIFAAVPVTTAFPPPADVVSLLTKDQQYGVVVSFFRAAGLLPERPAEPIEPTPIRAVTTKPKRTRRSTGASLSPDSNATTARETP